MTQQFDEGVKEIVLALLSAGATMYETNYILDQLKKRPEPIEQKIKAVEIVDDKINEPVFDRVAQEVINNLEQEAQQIPKEPSIEVHGKLETPVYIFKKLTDGGLTSTAAIGIIANIAVETDNTFDPNMKQYGGGPGRGIAQWERGGRFDGDRINLLKYAKKNGKSWNDLDTQIGFILHEMNVHPEYKRVKEEINKAKNVKQATEIFLKKYEKAGKPHTTRRFDYALKLKDKLESLDII